MRKILITITTIAILATVLLSAVYAMDNNSPKSYGLRGHMMYRYNYDSYKTMIETMRSNGFEAMADAMENGDYKAMSVFMNNMTDEQYEQMIQVMNNNGYSGMGRMMGSFGRINMNKMHNYMMRNLIIQQ